MGVIRIPLHEDCVKTGELCSICRSKINSGVIGEWEVNVMKALLELSEKLNLNHRYESSAIAGSTLYIALEGPPLEGLENELSKRIQVRGVGRVRVIYYSGGLDKLLEAIFGQRILSINRVYSSDGSLTIVVKVRKRDPGAAKLASLLLKTNVEVEVEAEKVRVDQVKIGKPDIRKILEKF